MKNIGHMHTIKSDTFFQKQIPFFQITSNIIFLYSEAHILPDIFENFSVITGKSFFHNTCGIIDKINCRRTFVATKVKFLF